MDKILPARRGEVPSFWRGLVRAFFWNDFIFSRIANWLNCVNIVLIFVPIPIAAFKPLFSAGCLLLTITAFLVWLYRVDRPHRKAFKQFQEQGDFWMAEMHRLLIELVKARSRYAAQHELNEIEAKLEYASDRCQRELNIFAGKRRK